MKPNPPFSSDHRVGNNRVVTHFPAAPPARPPPNQVSSHAPNSSIKNGQPYYGYPRGPPPLPANAYENQTNQRYPSYSTQRYTNANEQSGGSFAAKVFAKSRSGVYDQRNEPFYAQRAFEGPAAPNIVSRASFERNPSAPLLQKEVIRTTSSGSSGSTGSVPAARPGYPSGIRPYPRSAPALVNKYGHHPGVAPGIPPVALPPPPSLRATGPYTTAQLESMPRGPGKTLGKQLEVEKAQAGRQKEVVIYKPAHVHKSPPVKCLELIDPDDRAYTAITGRSGATSPSQIDSFRREDVVTMGCTCKKSKCLKLYCMCFGASVVCGQNCRCMICHNTPNHEQVRKDAIRNILARNPSAFDTKFKKSEDEDIKEAVTTKTGPNRAITHKLGCKCRKSFCTKKYCECYNAGVKCSESCRCVSCKNIPVGGLGPRSESPTRLPDSSGSTVLKKNSKQSPVVLRKTGEPWRVNAAAQHLAFLKHASPVKADGKPVRKLSGVRGNSITSLPSLAASDTSISPTEQEANGVNSLLMAAYAMTELFAQDAPGTTDDGTPEKQRIGVTEFRSPKRKTVEGGIPLKSVDAIQRNEIALEACVRTTTTPAHAHKVKRTRVGTVEKTRSVAALVAESSLLCEEDLDATPRPERSPTDSDGSEDDDDSISVGNDRMGDDTPAKSLTTPQCKRDPNYIMTPVTARCIDFQHMGVTDEKEDIIAEEKKDDATEMDQVQV